MKQPSIETTKNKLFKFSKQMTALGLSAVALGGCADVTRQHTLADDVHHDGFEMLSAAYWKDTMIIKIDGNCEADVSFKSFHSKKYDEYRAVDYTLEASPLTTFRNREELAHLVGDNICGKLAQLNG